MPADGNIFACKSGTVEAQSGSSRRVLFGFPGWTQRTKPPKAPKCLNLPREMTLDDGQMRLAPVHEMAWTLSARIISASETPISAVDIAPASVRTILPLWMLSSRNRFSPQNHTGLPGPSQASVKRSTYIYAGAHK